jgi:hypothetical protein
VKQLEGGTVTHAMFVDMNVTEYNTVYNNMIYNTNYLLHNAKMTDNAEDSATQ